MKLKTLFKKWSLPIISIAGIILFSAVIYFMVLDDLPDSASYIKPASVASMDIPGAGALGQESSGLPIHLQIPKIKVDSAIEHVGLTSNGAMAVPKGPVNAAWYDLGPRPGEIGSAVISGHYGWKNNIPAVFDNLHKLAKGDKIYVEDNMGKITVFVVRESKLFGENDAASEVFISSDGGSHLNLITCEGVYDKVRKSYSKRLVVFADKETE